MDLMLIVTCVIFSIIPAVVGLKFYLVCMKHVGDYVTKSEHIQTITAGVLLTACGTSGVWVGGYGLSADYVSTKGHIILVSIVLLALYERVANRAFVLLDNLKAKYGPSVFE